MDFGVLGSLKVQSDGHDLAIGSKRQRQLLAVLLVNAGRVVSNDRLIAALWGDNPPATEGSLYTYVSRLRGLLHSEGGELLITRPPGYLLQVDPAQTDAGRFERLVEQARAVATTQPEVASARLDDALALWRGPAYAEFADADFARSESTRLEELRLVAVEERFDVGLALGHHGELVGAIEAYSAQHPLRERPRAQLMLALYRCGRQAEALAAFREFRGRLDDELGVEPSAGLRSLETSILRQGAELDNVVPPVPKPTADVVADPPARALGALPGEASSLVGRDEDAETVIRALRDHRVLTLTGVGGVGKTRLAQQVAHRVADRYPDGAWWCELAPVSDGTAVAHALAAAIGVRQQAGWTIEQSITAFLKARHLLLVLDNCEHVVEHVATLVEDIVRVCPRVTVLATSRVSLGVTGEHIRPTAPLTVPRPEAGAAAADSAAVRLFVDRARAVRPDLDLGPDNLAHIAELCRQLDGLPLGIELAAARIRSINPADLVARSDDRFGLLTTTRPTVVPRHRALRAVVDWSYTLLSPNEQRLFARLAVFAGGFTLEAAERVCAEPDLLDLLTTLVDSSLVAAGSSAGQVRYSMLETLRAYGRELLENRGELHAIRSAHCTYYAAMADDAASGLRGPDEAAWIARLDADIDNLRAAHRWAVEQKDIDLALRISAGLYNYALYLFRDEVVSWGEAALDLPDAESHPLFSTVCGAVGEGLTLRGELRRARDIAQRALDDIADPDDGRRIPPIKVMLAVALYEGRLQDCYDWGDEQLRLAVMHGNTWYEAEAYGFQALVKAYSGDPKGALQKSDEDLRTASAMGNPSLLAWAYYMRAEPISQIDPDRALELYERAIALAKTVNSTFVTAVSQVGVAALLTRAGKVDDAFAAFGRCVRQWYGMQVWHHQWTTLRNLLQLLVRTGRNREAAVLLGALGRADTDAFGADAEDMAKAFEVLRAALGEEEFEKAALEGSALSPDAVVAFALRITGMSAGGSGNAG